MYDFLKSFNFLTEEEISGLMALSASKQLKKSDYFIREGETCREVAFIVSGLFRSYYVSDKGAEITYCINFPNSFTTAYSAFITGQQSQENIQAISDVEILVISKNEIEKLGKKSLNWMRFQKTIAEYQYIELENRIFELQKNDASQRYKNLLKNQPTWIHKVPLQYLASYLGITQRHLSRIRGNLVF